MFTIRYTEILLRFYYNSSHSRYFTIRMLYMMGQVIEVSASTDTSHLPVSKQVQHTNRKNRTIIVPDSTTTTHLRLWRR